MRTQDGVLQLGPEDSNSNHQVALGWKLVLRLPENPTTGFQWAVTSSTPQLTQKSSTFVPPDTTEVGAGGAHEFEFEAAEKGASVIEAKLIRSWEPDQVKQLVRVEIQVA